MPATGESDAGCGASTGARREQRQRGSCSTVAAARFAVVAATAAAAGIWVRRCGAWPVGRVTRACCCHAGRCGVALSPHFCSGGLNSIQSAGNRNQSDKFKSRQHAPHSAYMSTSSSSLASLRSIHVRHLVRVCRVRGPLSSRRRRDRGGSTNYESCEHLHCLLAVRSVAACCTASGSHADGGLHASAVTQPQLRLLALLGVACGWE